MVRSVWYSRTFAIGLFCVGLGIPRIVEYSQTFAIGSLYVGLGIVGSVEYSRTFVMGLFCVGLGMFGLVGYSRTSAMAVLCVGLGIVGRHLATDDDDFTCCDADDFRVLCYIGVSCVMHIGQMSERSKETVLKTVEGQPSASSNLALSASRVPGNSFAWNPFLCESVGL